MHKQSFIKNDKIEICNTFYNIISFIERETQMLQIDSDEVRDIKI